MTLQTLLRNFCMGTVHMRGTTLVLDSDSSTHGAGSFLYVFTAFSTPTRSAYAAFHKIGALRLSHLSLWETTVPLH
jgi:hypothetical protein